MKHMRKALAFVLSLVLVFSTMTGTTAVAVGGNQPQANVTLTFYANGGDASSVPDPITVAANTEITIPEKKPTRDGYKFLGWAFSSATTQPSNDLKPGAKYVLKGNTKAYAVWHTTCTLTYDANGGTNAPAAVKDYGEIKITTDKPKRDGYTFFGWGQTAGATEAWKKAGDTYDLKANVTFYAVWKQFTLTFNANGGTGAPAALKGGTVKIPETEPTRSSYSFLGWALSASATSPAAAYAKGKTVEDMTSNLTLYAVWKKAYTLTFDINGGWGTAPDPVSGDTVTIPERGNRYGRTNYDFIGWADSKTATTAKYQPHETMNLTADKTVYAVWISESSTTKVLSYSANGGDFSLSPDQVFHAKGDITLSTAKPTRTGYTFLGWTEYYNYEFAIYQPGTTYTLSGYGYSLDEQDTLYAVWAPEGSTICTITYNGNGGTGAPQARKGYGRIKTPDYCVTRSGYTQRGWNTKADGTGTTYGSGEFVKFSSDRTLYALWKQFTLTYNANGGTGVPASQKGGDVTISTTQPTRIGYTFLGWGLRADSTAPNSNYAAGKTIKLTNDLTLYAVWGFKLEFSSNASGDTVTGMPSTVYSQTTTATVPEATPTRSGYTFLGWAASSSATVASYHAGDSVNLGRITMLYAVWESEQTYTLYLKPNGTNVSGMPANVTVHSKYATVPSGTPTRLDYKFLGWSSSSTATTATYQAGDTIDLTRINTLYAVWVQYTLTFDANGGTGAPTAQKGITVTIPGDKPTRSGYTFLGWSTSSTATSANPRYNPDNNVTLTANLTIYAVWQKNSSVVTQGDLNDDGDVDEGDATIILRLAAGLIDESSLTPEQLAAADVNHDGDVDEADATIILRYSAGLIPELP